MISHSPRDAFENQKFSGSPIFLPKFWGFFTGGKNLFPFSSSLSDLKSHGETPSLWSLSLDISKVKYLLRVGIWTQKSYLKHQTAGGMTRCLRYVTMPCKIPHRPEKTGWFFSPEVSGTASHLPQDYTVAISECGKAQRWRNALWLFQCMRQVSCLLPVVLISNEWSLGFGITTWIIPFMWLITRVSGLFPFQMAWMAYKWWWS